MSLAKMDDTLLHNHIGENYRYAYPLIQYKRIGGKAAIVAIGQGISHLKEICDCDGLTIKLGGDAPREFRVIKITQESADFAIGSDSFAYHLTNWLPLNQKNYKQYISSQGVVAKNQMLERILVGNILSVTKDLGYRIDQRLICTITDIKEPRLSTFKDIKLMSFDLDFCSNIILPDFIGLGKNVSKGYGMVKMI